MQHYLAFVSRIATEEEQSSAARWKTDKLLEKLHQTEHVVEGVVIHCMGNRCTSHPQPNGMLPHEACVLYSTEAQDVPLQQRILPAGDTYHAEHVYIGPLVDTLFPPVSDETQTQLYYIPSYKYYKSWRNWMLWCSMAPALPSDAMHTLWLPHNVTHSTKIDTDAETATTIEIATPHEPSNNADTISVPSLGE